MEDKDRRNPDVLLAALQQDETRRGRGRLKVFLGMCPGVGKTFAMLEAAHRERQAGRDVVVGFVETHGRAETAALVEGLPKISRTKILYRDVTLPECDLDAALRRRPQLILVDELAHSNAPGCRHLKRWQDVAELLEAGIDVFTTLNVQHVASRADTVRQITGTEIRETVPDSVLDGAAFKLVDLAPGELIQRLQEGKVYVADRAEAAVRSFFGKPISWRCASWRCDWWRIMSGMGQGSFGGTSWEPPHGRRRIGDLPCRSPGSMTRSCSGRISWWRWSWASSWRSRSDWEGRC